MFSHYIQVIPPLDNLEEFLSLCTVYTLQAFVYTSISLFIALKKKKSSLIGHSFHGFNPLFFRNFMGAKYYL